MTEPETDTALCAECQVPIDAPKLVVLSPFMAYKPVPLCKDCQRKCEQTQLMEQFSRRHVRECPYKFPGWRPKR